MRKMLPQSIDRSILDSWKNAKKPNLGANVCPKIQ